MDRSSNSNSQGSAGCSASAASQQSTGAAPAASNSPANAEALIVPSAQVPWSVEVISVMPKDLSGKLSELDSGAVTSDGPLWVCLGLSPQGMCFAYPQDGVGSLTTTTTARQISATSTTTLDATILQPPRYVGHLQHPSLKNSNTDHPNLFALERHDRQAVCVYALNPLTGQLFAKKLSPMQIRTSIIIPFTGKSRMLLPTTSTSSPPQEVMTCLQVFPHALGILVVGTSLGRLWLIKCSSMPFSLHCYPLAYDELDSSSSSSSSLLGRLFGTTPSKKKMRMDPSATGSSTRAQAILPLPHATSSSGTSRTTTKTATNNKTTSTAPSSAPARFWMVTQGGIIVGFEPSNTNAEAPSSPSSPTTPNVPWNYSSHTVARLADAFPQTQGRPTQLQVLQAAMDPTLIVDQHGSGRDVKLVAHFVVETQGRLYWMTCTAVATAAFSTTSSSFHVVRVHWLNRFPDGATVHVSGLVVAGNRIAYAAMSPSADTGPVLIMALDSNKLPLAASVNSQMEDDDDDDDEAAIYEVDLPVTQVPSLLPHTLTLDRVTHGCTLLTTAGVGVRIRCLPPTTTPRRPPAAASTSHAQTSTAPLQDVSTTSDNGIQASKLLTLTSHLRSAFWHAYQHYEGGLSTAVTAAVAVPPSLEQASAAYLEATVVSVSQQLQEQPGEAAAASSQNPLEWHLAYINYLQQGGLYRKLSTSTRYKLMGIGQEVTVFSHLLQQTNQQQGILTSRLQPMGIANWFYDIAQNHQFLNSSTTSTKEQQDARVLWCVWLSLALKAAALFRKERAGTFYDIPPEPELHIRSTLLEAAVDGTQYLWTSQRVLQTCMVELLRYCKNSRVSTVQQGLIETVVQAALQSHVDSAFTTADQERYADVKALAIPLLRSMVHRDDLAFSWSIDHCYFEGICQIAKDHEKHHDEKKYCLDAALFARLQDCVDTTTGLAFGPFCLQWHAERGLYGHVLNYGHFGCPKPDDLHRLLQRDERLRPYRWIHSIRQGDYVAATEHLLTNSKDPDVSYSDLNLSLSLAKLSNLVVEQDAIAPQHVTKECHQYIDKKQEQIHAQRFLLAAHPLYGPNDDAAITDPAAPFHLRTPDELLSWTLDEKLIQVKDQDVRVSYCMIGIAICLTMDDKKSSNGDETEMALGAARVWAKAILLEAPLWLEWIQTQPDLTDTEVIDSILESTVVGRALKQCWKDPSSTKVAYGPWVERNVMALLSWDHVATTEMKRLLKHVCSQGRSRQ